MSQNTDGNEDIATLDVEGRSVRVSLRTRHDEIEFIGQLWFGEDDGSSRAVVDHASLPGPTIDDVVALARRLTLAELRQRYDRAMRERRRFNPLRRVTQDLLAKVRRLNQVAIALQAGLVESGDGADQLADTEAQLHALVDRLRDAAGIQGESDDDRRVGEGRH
jgi:hypothetical protein